MSKVTIEEAYAAAQKLIRPWIVAFLCSMILNLVFALMLVTAETTSESYVDADTITAEGFSSAASVKE